LTPIGLTVRAGLSLNARLLIAASVVLTAFLGLTGLTLDRAFRDSALAQVHAALKVHVYALLAAADLDPAERLVVPKQLPEARFGTPGSGLYAQVNAASGALVWRSPSMLGLGLPFEPVYHTGVAAFQDLTGPDGARYFALGLAVEWEASPKKSYGYTFYVAEQSDAFDALVLGFRQGLWGWLVGAAVVLLAVQGLIWRWGLAPLRRVALEVAEIEAGRQSELRSSYPSELCLLTERLNALLRNRGAHLERYRHALADLAHSFKTPLAVIRSAIDDKGTPAPLQALLREQVEGLNRTVEYQLQRAAASGRTVLARPIEVEPAVRKLERTLAKVHADKGVQFDLQVTQGLRFHGDEGDLVEVLGNLLDNACKWARREVALRARPEGAGAGLVIEVEDDGPGVPEDLKPAIGRRGVRADPKVGGHGIGLAVVREIVEGVYGGRLEFGRGALGGALVRVWL
jgi:two-component system, OmpR family, sensor histidine kinase PhoQ